MSKNTLRGTERDRLLEELHARYASGKRHGNKSTYLRKKYLWLATVWGAKVFKRTMDIIISSVGLIVLSPLFLVMAVLIKLTDGGPILYVSQRVGKWGKEFAFPKFRSMYVNADQIKAELQHLSQHEDLKTFKIKTDPRVTWIGKIMRRFSLDELPQLWCVLIGEMSLVGPRPPLPNEVAMYTLEDRRRLDVVPGLTCFWQVGGRSEIPFDEQVKLDVQYIESQSLWVDFKLLLKTIPAVLFGKGAY